MNKLKQSYLWIVLLVIVLLSTAIGSIQLYRKIGNIENQSKVNLYSLVPCSSTAILEIRNISMLSRDIHLNMSKLLESKQRYSTLPKEFFEALFYTKNGISTLEHKINSLIIQPYSKDSLHNPLSISNNLLVSYHINKEGTNYMFYIKTNGITEASFTHFIHEKFKIRNNPKVIHYRSKKVLIYFLSTENDYLVAYIGKNYIVFSSHFYLVREMIDAIRDKNNLSLDSSFKEIENSKSTCNAIVYVDMEKIYANQQTTRKRVGVNSSGWAVFDLELKHNNIYLTGMVKSKGKSTLLSTLHSQSKINTFPSSQLPLSTIYFRHISISNLLEWKHYASIEWGDKENQFVALLDKYSVHQVCDVIMKEDTTHHILVFPMKQKFSRSNLGRYLSSYRFDRSISTLGKIQTNHLLELFSDDDSSYNQADWYLLIADDKLICSKSLVSLKKYFSETKEGLFLDSDVRYQAIINQFEVPYQMLIVNDLTQTVRKNNSIVQFVPYLVERCKILSNHYQAALQINSQNDNTYINIVLASSRN